jgi:hypothetical protein
MRLCQEYQALDNLGRCSTRQHRADNKAAGLIGTCRQASVSRLSALLAGSYTAELKDRG